MSNHSEAKAYKLKCQLLGVNILDFELLDNDAVVLMHVLDKERTGKIVIPSFITQIHDNEGNFYKPFYTCKFNEIYIDNKPKTFRDISGMLSGIGSKSLTFGMRNSECVGRASSLFENSYSLQEINFKSFNTENIQRMDRMFSRCFRLKRVDLSGFKTNKLVTTSEMFQYCQLE